MAPTTSQVAAFLSTQGTVGFTIHVLFMITYPIAQRETSPVVEEQAPANGTKQDVQGRVPLLE